MMAFDFVGLSMAVVVAAIASAQPFETKTDCVKALPTGKSDELCIKCQSFADCPSGSKWMVVDLRSRSRRIAKAAGVNPVKCSNGSIMDDAGKCVQTFHIPNTTGGTFKKLFELSTTTSTTASTSTTSSSTSTSTTQKSFDNIVPSDKPDVEVEDANEIGKLQESTASTSTTQTFKTTQNLTKIFETLDNTQVIKNNDTTVVIFLAFFLISIFSLFFYIIFSCRPKSMRISRQLSRESLTMTEHSIA